MKEENGVGFILSGISTEEFAILEKDFDKEAEFGLNTGVEFKIDEFNHQLGCFVSFELDEKGKKLIRLKVGCHFHIEDNAWNDFNIDNDIIVPKGFASHLAMITVGTARGVFHAKTDNTPFYNIVIPTIDVTKFFEKDLIFHTNKLEDEE